MERFFDIPELLEATLVHLSSSDLFRLVCIINKTWHTLIFNSVKLKHVMFLAQDSNGPLRWNPALQREHPELHIKAQGTKIPHPATPGEHWLHLQVRERAGHPCATRPSRYDTSKVLSTYVCQPPIKSMVVHLDFRTALAGTRLCGWTVLLRSGTSCIRSRMRIPIREPGFAHVRTSS